MMDERCLVDLINERFDDMNDKIDNLKSDMLRESAAIKAAQTSHEAQDATQFKNLHADLGGLKNLKMTVMGASSGAFAVVAIVFKVVEHFLK